MVVGWVVGWLANNSIISQRGTVSWLTCSTSPSIMESFICMEPYDFHLGLTCILCLFCAQTGCEPSKAARGRAFHCSPIPLGWQHEPIGPRSANNDTISSLRKNVALID